MTDDLQAEIDLEAARIRAFRDYKNKNAGHRGSLLLLSDDDIVELANHLVRDKAVPVYANTERLVEAARKIAKMPCITMLLGDERAEDDPCGCASCVAEAALSPFEKGEGK